MPGGGGNVIYTVRRGYSDTEYSDIPFPARVFVSGALARKAVPRSPHL